MSYPKKQISPSWQLKSFALLLKTFKSWANCTSRIFYIVFILLLTANIIDAQTIRYVKMVSTGTGDGSSWANASGQIQDMINASSPGDSVFVKGGYFRPNNAVSRFHMKSGVSIYGSFNGTETNSAQRIKNYTYVSKFSATYTGSTADRISTFINNNVDSTGKLDGFTFENCFGGDSTAGAIQNYNSSPTISNCRFTYIYANSDGVHPNGASIRNFHSNPKFINCLFWDNKGNRTTGDPTGASFLGGEVMYNWESTPTIINCSFYKNYAVDNTIYYPGIAIYNDQGSSIKAVNTIFYDRNVVAYKDLGNKRSEVTYSIALDTIGGGSTNVEHLTTNPFVTNMNGAFEVSVSWSSPARDGGDPLTNTPGYPIQIGNKDLDFNKRINGSRVDIGAFELDGSVYPFISNFSNFSKSYGDLPFNLAAISESPAPITYTSGNDAVATISGSAVTILKAGTVTITASQAAVAGFPAISKTVTMTVARATLDIVGLSSSKVVGQSDPQLYFKIGTNGLKYNDAASIITGTITRTAGETVGTYAINVGTLAASNNYNINYTAANFYIGVAKYVKPVASGLGNATTWADASGDLQATIALANNGDQVWVAAGNYTSSATSNSFTLKDNVAVYGGFFGNETTLEQRNWNANTTTLTTNQAVTGNALIDNGSIALGNLTRLDGFTITNTYGGVMAGAMYNNNASPTISNCIFNNNSAGTGASTTRVAGIYNYNGSSPVIVNSKFINNNSGLVVGAIYDTLNAAPSITNVTFSNNSAALASGVYNTNNSTATITNSIFWGDTQPQIVNSVTTGTSTSTVTYSDVQLSSGTYTGTGNLNIDPVFVNADFSLQSTSSLIDAGDPNTNTTILSSQAGAKDLRNSTRISSDVIDMGAYEFIPSITPTITGFNNLVKTYGNSDFTITPTSTSPAAITYVSSDTNIATVSNLGVIHIVNAGTITITLNQKSSGNYTKFSQSISLLINKAPLDLICDTLYKAVGTPDPVFTFTTGQNTYVYNDNASNVFTGAISRIPAGELVGGFSTVIGTLTARNYNINFISAKFFIENITTVTMANLTKTYGDQDFALNVTSNSDGYLTYTSSDPSIVKLTGIYPTMATFLKSGTVTITITQDRTINYSPGSTTSSITVNKAPLDINVNTVTKRKREVDPTLTYTVGANGNNFVRNDDVTVLSGTISRTAGEDVGIYPINIGTLSSDQYSFNFTSANLNIVPNVTRRYVKQDATGDGASWANASGNIQAMVDSSYSGDSIWVAKGLYSRTQSYLMKEGVHLYGGFAGTEDSIEKRNWLLNEVVLQNTTDNQPIINYQAGTTISVLDGFTVKGDARNINAQGIKVDNANINISNAKIINNTALMGAGIYNVSNVLNGKNVNIVNSIFSNNSATSGGGAAIFNKNSKINIKNSLFDSNKASDNSAGAILDSTNATIDIANATFYNNTSSIGSDPFLMNTAATITNSIIMDSVQSALNYNNVKYSLVPAGMNGVGNKHFGTYAYKDIFDASANNFNLNPRSIAIDAGDPQTNASTYAIQVGNKDLSLQNRIVWGKIDLGAYEYQSLKPTDIVAKDTTTTFGDNDIELYASSNSTGPVVYALSDTTNAKVYQNTTTGKWYIKAKDYGTVYIKADVLQVDPFATGTKTFKLEIQPFTITASKDTAQCGNLIWNNITYDKTGNYTQFFKHIRAGVDSFATMRFRYKPIPSKPIITNSVKNLFATSPATYTSTENDYYLSRNYLYTHQICSNAVDSIQLISSDNYFNHWYRNDVLLTDTSSSIKIIKSGKYKLEINWDGCKTSSSIDTVVDRSIAGSGFQLHDTLLCKATYLPIEANAFWNGFNLNDQTLDSYLAPTFSWTSKNKTFVNSSSKAELSLPDTYYVKINAVGCLVNDSIVVRNTADTAIKARFTVSQQAFVDQVIQAVSYTTPKPQSLTWAYPSGAIILQNQDTVLSLKFPSISYANKIKLTARSYDVCYSYDSAYIQIVAYDSSKLVNPNEVKIRTIAIGPNPSYTGIYNLSVGLNVPGAISYGVWNINGLNPIRPTVIAQSEKQVTFTVDISSQPQGAYLLVIQTANSYEVRTLLNKY